MEATILFAAVAVSIATASTALAVVGLWSGSPAGVARWHRKNVARAAKAGHNAHDPNCRYWRGDSSSVDFEATCPPCSPFGRRA